ncbi:MAG: hypothetical protein HY744_10830 [Deltaproteobacteria bacterium]|nr:hypothetical protein [Deltaproteobacteria bacterium]
MRRALLLCLVLGLAGCTSLRAFIASPADWAEYRRVRLAPTLDERLAASRYYLEHRPDGAFAADVRAYFDRAEPVFYDVRRRSVAGMEAYLRALPRGPHAGKALAELVLRRHEQRRATLDERSVAQRSARLEAEKAARRQAAEAATWWVQALLDPVLWLNPLTEAPAELLVRYRLSLPSPECENDAARPEIRRCSKLVELPYRVAGEGSLEDRQLTLELRLTMDHGGRLHDAALLGPSLFLREQEAREHRASADGDAAAQRRAAQGSVAALEAALREPPSACAREPSGGGETRLRCGMLGLAVRPGLGREDDAIRIAPR